MDKVVVKYEPLTNSSGGGGGGGGVATNQPDSKEYQVIRSTNKYQQQQQQIQQQKATKRKRETGEFHGFHLIHSMSAETLGTLNPLIFKEPFHFVNSFFSIFEKKRTISVR